MSTTRHLAAILAADVVGYSRLMGADEEGTLKRLQEIQQKVIDPAVAKSGGRIVKTTGDGFLIEFPSAVEAVRCALEIQEQVGRNEQERASDQQFQFRIGINVGDVIASEGDIHGDGVNVAARLEALAEAGGILISATVHVTAANRLQCSFDDLGERSLKNIEKPVHVYRVRAVEEVAERPSLPLPDKPSIAVLPFQNMSGDADQEYFADGMVEEIITGLSRVRSFFVIARNSSFTYKGRAVDVKQVGRELGVRYVLEGSVRKAANRVRITGQLIDSTTGIHLWADRFDGALEDIFQLQDRVTEAVVNAIEPAIRLAEIRRAQGKPTEKLDAYDLYLRALAHVERLTRDDLEEALRLLRRAIALDANYALAKGLAAWCALGMVNLGWWSRESRDVIDWLHVARSTLAMSSDDPMALCYTGLAVAYLGLDIIAGRAAIDRALAISPSSATVLICSATIHLYAGEYAAARDEYVQAMRLSPLDPNMRHILVGLSNSLSELGDLEEALVFAQRAVATAQGGSYGTRSIILCLVGLGRLDEAREVTRRFLVHNPGYTIADARSMLAPFTNSYRERQLERYRLAGIPE